MDYLNLEALKFQTSYLGQLEKKVDHIQFDDLITTEKTKLKPVSVSVAVDASTRVILGARASQIPAFGHLAKLSKKKYGRRISRHKEGLTSLFKDLKLCTHPNTCFESDEHKLYPDFVQKYFPDSTHNRFKGGRGCVVGQGELKKLNSDPLFYINHTCAMLRDNLKRLTRRTWCVTQKLENLQKHLNIYIWYHNSVILSG